MHNLVVKDRSLGNLFLRDVLLLVDGYFNKANESSFLYFFFSLILLIVVDVFFFTLIVVSLIEFNGLLCAPTLLVNIDLSLSFLPAAVGYFWDVNELVILYF